MLDLDRAVTPRRGLIRLGALSVRLLSCAPPGLLMWPWKSRNPRRDWDPCNQ